MVGIEWDLSIPVWKMTALGGGPWFCIRAVGSGQALIAPVHGGWARFPLARIQPNCLESFTPAGIPNTVSPLIWTALLFRRPCGTEFEDAVLDRRTYLAVAAGA